MNRIDVLVQNFFARIHSQSYIIYPPSFLEEYCDWWADRLANKALGLQWTCLLLIVCACSTQNIQHQLRRSVEDQLGEELQTASGRYHLTARELHAAIPISYWDMTSVQQLLHSCLWYNYDARFVESWHVLNVAIRLAQELRKFSLYECFVAY